MAWRNWFRRRQSPPQEGQLPPVEDIGEGSQIVGQQTIEGRYNVMAQALEARKDAVRRGGQIDELAMSLYRQYRLAAVLASGGADLSVQTLTLDRWSTFVSVRPRGLTSQDQELLRDYFSIRAIMPESKGPGY